MRNRAKRIRRADETPDYGDHDYPRFTEDIIDAFIHARFLHEREETGIVHITHKETF